MAIALVATLAIGVSIGVAATGSDGAVGSDAASTRAPSTDATGDTDATGGAVTVPESTAVAAAEVADEPEATTAPATDTDTETEQDGDSDSDNSDDIDSVDLGDVDDRADDPDAQTDHGGHVATVGTGTGGWLAVDDDPAVYRDAQTPASYSFFDPAAMNDPDWGESRIGFFVECESVGHDQIDPIVAPGAERSSHLHEFFGTVVNSDLTTQQLADVPQSDIHCTDTNDKSAYWSPAVYQDGELVTASTFKAYYKSPTPDVEEMPLGLRIVAGDAAATGNQRPTVGGWVGEGNKFNDVNTYGARQMIERPNGDVNIALRVNYPQCWDGVHLDSPDHQSHMAYAEGGSCPASHPVRLPQLVTFAQYDVRGGDGLTLSSGEWFTFHQDFWNGWSPDQMSELVDACIVESMMCRVRTTPALVRLGQYVATVPGS